MRFYYLDAGLVTFDHHSNYCRYIVGEVRARGLEALVFANAGIDSAPRSELSATPHFRVYTYAEGDADPVCGWLTGFERTASWIYEDLMRLPAPKAGDIVFMSSLSPAQLVAMAAWLTAIPAARRPCVVLEMVSPGLGLGQGAAEGWKIPHPLIDPRPTLFRYASLRLGQQHGLRLNFISFTPTLAHLFGELLQAPVQVAPLPYRAVNPLRNRAGARPVVVAILGHHKSRKGYDKLPEIAARLLEVRADVRLLVQAVSPADAPDALMGLRHLAASDDRLTLCERVAGEEGWPLLLEKSDLMLCAYRPQFHFVGFSAVAAEALANGIPTVLPGGSPMAKWLEECGGGGTTFDCFEANEISTAVERALDDFDRYATLAYTGGLAWPTTRGPARLLDAVMALAQRDDQLTDESSVPPAPGRRPNRAERRAAKKYHRP